MGKRYIDADFCKMIGGTCIAVRLSTGEVFPIVGLDGVPSAQPEIIRCKDCKHRPFDGEDTQGFRVEFPDEKCPCQCDDCWYNWRPSDEWFCANGERIADGEEVH